MDNKIKLLFIIGTIIFIVIILAINISIEGYTKKYLSPTKEQPLFKMKGEMPVEKGERLQFPNEESEQTSPIPAVEPLLQ